jgi:hypothetical protein
VIKDDALAAARELDTAKLGELPFRLRDLVVRAGNGRDPDGQPHAAAESAAADPDGAAPEDLIAGHTSYPSDRILPLAASAPDPAVDYDVNAPKRVAEALVELHGLLAAGVLDQDEYAAKKRELLARL